MNQLTYRRLMKGIDPSKPGFNQLYSIFMSALKHLKPDPSEWWRVSVAFHLSFYGHQRAPIRDNGDAYFLHPFQIALRVIAIQRRLGIQSMEWIIVVLLHDCFEEVPDDLVSPLLIRSRVGLLIGAETAYRVHCLTKQRWQRGEESNDAYFERLLREGDYLAITGKFGDRENNGLSLHACNPPSRRVRKIAETYKWFPILKTQLQLLIDREIDAGRLGEAWRHVPSFLYRSLFRTMREQKKSLKPT